MLENPWPDLVIALFTGLTAIATIFIAYFSWLKNRRDKQEQLNQRLENSPTFSNFMISRSPPLKDKRDITHCISIDCHTARRTRIDNVALYRMRKTAKIFTRWEKIPIQFAAGEDYSVELDARINTPNTIDGNSYIKIYPPSEHVMEPAQLKIVLETQLGRFEHCVNSEGWS